jgi:hypothetical protein
MKFVNHDKRLELKSQLRYGKHGGNVEIKSPNIFGTHLLGYAVGIIFDFYVPLLHQQ